MKKQLLALLVVFTGCALTVKGQFVNTGLLSVAGGQMSVVSNATNNNAASLTVSVGATLTLAANYTSQPTGATTNNGTIQVAGNWQNQGSGTYSGSGTVQLNGAGAQSFGNNGDNVAVFNISNTGGASLSSPLTVTNQLQFGATGLLTTSSGALLTLTPVATVTGASSTAYVNGPMVVQSTGGGPIVFPIGKTPGGYAPITFPTSTANVQAEVIQGTPYTATSATSTFQRFSANNRYWQVQVVSGTVSTGTLNAGFNNTTVDGNLTNTASSPNDAITIGIKSGGANASGAYTQLNYAAGTTGHNVGTGGTINAGLATTLTVGGSPYYFVTGVNKVVVGAIVPPSATCFADQAVLNSSSVSPTLNATYQWNLGGTPISGATTATYTTPPLTANGNYSVTVDNSGTTPAYEPTTSATLPITLSPALQVSLTVILQGAYNTGTGLMSSNFTPAQLAAYYGPFTGSNAPTTINTGAGPYDYTTSLVNLDFVDRYPTGPVPLGAPVDVVQVGVRSSQTAVEDGLGTVIPNQRRLAWLYPNGTINEFKTAGSTLTNYVSFCGLATGNYYVVVRHRNHLPIMSKNPIAYTAGNNSSASIDLTNKANVMQAVANLQEGGYLFFQTNKLAMFAGKIGERDRTSARFINAYDFFHVYYVNGSGLTGFRQQDVNLDGVVNAADYQFIQLNVDNLYLSGVPTW